MVVRTIRGDEHERMDQENRFHAFRNRSDLEKAPFQSYQHAVDNSGTGQVK